MSNGCYLWLYEAYRYRVISFWLHLAGVFDMSRQRSKLGRSYVEYGMGTPIYNLIDADSADIVLNNQNLISKGLVYNFLHPFLRTGLLTSTGWFSNNILYIF